MSRSPRSPSRRFDAVGLGLVALLALWVGVFAGGGEGRPWPVLLLLAGMVLATATGRVLSNRPGLVSRLVAVGIAGSFVLTWPGVLSAGGAPLGYANANATLASLGLIAALAAAQSEPDVAVRRGWVGLAGLLGALTVVTGSMAGVLVLAVALVLAGLSIITRWAGFVIVGGLLAVSLAVGVTTAVALGSDVASLGERAGTRGELWVAAADFAFDEPFRGIGPGQFAERNPVSSDADLRWAHHGYLQAAAEYGLLGLLLVVGLLGWVSAMLWVAAADRVFSSSLVAVPMTVTVVGLHATVDYLWHLPPVLLVACTLFGSGTAARGRAGQPGVGVATDLVADGAAARGCAPCPSRAPRSSVTSRSGRPESRGR